MRNEASNMNIYIYIYILFLQRHCEVYDNKLAGVAIRNEASPLLYECTISGGRDAGVLVYSGVCVCECVCECVSECVSVCARARMCVCVCVL